MFLQVSTSSEAVDLGLLINQLMEAAGTKSWWLFAGLVIIAVLELAGRLGLMNWLPEKARSPVKLVMQLLGMVGKGLVGMVRKPPAK